jgi:hypothetical protein
LIKCHGIRTYIPKADVYIQGDRRKHPGGGISVAGNKRYENAHLVRNYLKGQNITHAEVTAHDIAAFHGIPGKRVPSISALLNFLQRNHMRNNRYGFFISGTQTSRRSCYPHHFQIELMDVPG